MKFSSQSVLYNLWSQPVFSWHRLAMTIISLAVNCDVLSFVKPLVSSYMMAIESNLGSSVSLITRAHLCQSDVL